MSAPSGEAGQADVLEEDVTDIPQLLTRIKLNPRDTKAFEKLLVPALEATKDVKHPLCGKDVTRDAQLALDEHRELQMCMLRVKSFKMAPEVQAWLDRLERVTSSCEDCIDVYAWLKEEMPGRYLHVFPLGAQMRFLSALHEWEAVNALARLEKSGIAPGSGLGSISSCELYACVFALMGSRLGPEAQRAPTGVALISKLGSALQNHQVLRRANLGLLALALSGKEMQGVLAGGSVSPREWAREQLADLSLEPISESLTRSSSMVRFLAEQVEKSGNAGDRKLFARFLPAADSSGANSLSQALRSLDWTTLAKLIPTIEITSLPNVNSAIISNLGNQSYPELKGLLEALAASLKRLGASMWKAQPDRAGVALTALLDNADFPETLCNADSSAAADPTTAPWTGLFLASLQGAAQAEGSECKLDLYEDGLRRFAHVFLERLQQGHVEETTRHGAMLAGLDLLQQSLQADEPKESETRPDLDSPSSLRPATSAPRRASIRHAQTPCADAVVKVAAIYAPTLANLALRGRLPNSNRTFPTASLVRQKARTLVESIYTQDAQRLERALRDLGTLALAHDALWSSRKRHYKGHTKHTNGPTFEQVYEQAAAGPWPKPLFCACLWTEGKKSVVADEDPGFFMQSLARLSPYGEPTLGSLMIKEVENSTHFPAYKAALKGCILHLSRQLRTMRGALSSTLNEVGNSGGETTLQSVCTQHTDGLVITILCSEMELNRAALNLVRSLFEDATSRADCFLALLRCSPNLALKGLEEYLHSFIHAATTLVESNDAARWVVRSFTDVLDSLCSPYVGLLRVGTPHSFRDTPAAMTAVSEKLISIWTLMCQSVATIFRCTPAWAKYVPQEDMIPWFRDVLLFASDAVDHVRTVESAVIAATGDAANAEETLFSALALPLEEATHWLRISDVAILSDTRDYIVKALERFKTDKALPPAVQQAILEFIDAQLAEEDLDKRKTLLSTPELVNLRALLEAPAPVESDASVESEDEPVITSIKRASPTPSFWQSSQSQTPQKRRKHRLKQQKLSFKPPSAVSISSVPRPQPVVSIPRSVASTSVNKYKAVGTSSSSKVTAAPARAALGSKLSALRNDFNASRAGWKQSNVNQRSRLPSDRDLNAPITAPPAYSKVTGLLTSSTSRPTAKPKYISSSSSSESSEDEGTETKGLAALSMGKRKSPIKLVRKMTGSVAAPARRTVMLQDSRLQELARQRAEVERKRRLRQPPDFAQLHRSILAWDFWANGSEPPAQPGKPAPQFHRVPAGFKTATEYAEVFGPMLLLECWAELQNAKEELERGNLSADKKPIPLEVQGRSNVDGFVDINAVLLQPHTNARGMRFSDTDVVYIREVGFEGVGYGLQRPRTVLAKVEAFRTSGQGSAITLRCYLSSDQQGVSAALVSRSRWELCKLFALTTLHRECAALMALADYDLVRDVLQGIAPPRGSLSESELNQVMESYQVNQPQAEAIIGALQSEKGISLIQGPPGTGKTKTICSLIAHFVTTRKNAPALVTAGGGAPVMRDVKKKILLCAPSNAAIDEVARRAKIGFKNKSGVMVYPSVVRVGREETMNVAVRDISLEYLLEQRLGQSKGTVSTDADPSAIHAEIKTLSDEREGKQRELNNVMNAGGNAAKVAQLQTEIKAISSRRMNAMSRLDEAKDRKQTAARQQDADRRRLQSEILCDADVVCTTLAGAGHPLLAQLTFDFETVIIDEAAQAVELSSLIPLRYGCKRAILVGDPHQLPPTVISQRAERLGYSQSLFVRIFKANQPVYLLSIQYRMHPLISSFPSQTFYASKLEDGPGMAEATAQPWHAQALLAPFKFFDAAQGQEKAARGHSVTNPYEAIIAAAIYDRLKYEARRTGKDLDYRVGVVTMYKEQLFELKRVFASRFGPDVAQTVDFNTVDGFQGQEKDVIILSCVRTQALGFLADARRVNVALTRAKSNVFVVGCARLLRSNEGLWGSLVTQAERLGVLQNVTPQTFNPGAAYQAPTPIVKPFPSPRKSSSKQAPAPTAAPIMTPAELSGSTKRSRGSDESRQRKKRPKGLGNAMNTASMPKGLRSAVMTQSESSTSRPATPPDAHEPLLKRPRTYGPSAAVSGPNDNLSRPPPPGRPPVRPSNGPRAPTSNADGVGGAEGLPSNASRGPKTEMRPPRLDTAQASLEPAAVSIPVTSHRTPAAPSAPRPIRPPANPTAAAESVRPGPSKAALAALFVPNRNSAGRGRGGAARGAAPRTKAAFDPLTSLTRPPRPPPSS